MDWFRRLPRSPRTPFRNDRQRAKPMSQDSYSAGFDFEVNPRTVATFHFVHNNLNRTIEDLGALVDGNEAYLLGNPGEGTTSIMPASAAPLTGGGSFPMPKAKRQYDAVELGISRRFSNNWFGSANVTISRLYGNYAGIASSDEIRTPTTGVRLATAQQQAGSSIFREGGNVNRGWDLDDAMFDSHGNLDVLGRLATDRPRGRQVLRRLQCGAQHANRRVRVCRQRHADDDLRELGQPDGALRRRPRRHGPHARCSARPTCSCRTSCQWRATSGCGSS